MECKSQVREKAIQTKIYSREKIATIRTINSVDSFSCNSGKLVQTRHMGKYTRDVMRAMDIALLGQTNRWNQEQRKVEKMYIYKTQDAVFLNVNVHIYSKSCEMDHVEIV